MKTALPLDIQISFHKLIEAYRRQETQASCEITRRILRERLQLVEQYPELEGSWEETSELIRLSQPLSILLQEFFPSILSQTELKAVSVPFQDLVFQPTHGLQEVLEAAGADYELDRKS